MQVVVNDTLVHYTEEGKGKILLCLHGWMHDHTSYAQLAAELKSQYKLISLDLPNFGASQMTDTITSLDDYADFMAAFAAKLQIKDYALLGHSMGGQLDMYAVAHHKLQPTHLVLIASAGVRNQRPLKRKVLQALAKPGKYIVPNKYKEKFYNAIGSDYSPTLSPVHKKVIGEVLKTDTQDDAKLITVPTLLIYGQDDIFTTPKMGQTLHEAIKGSRLELLPDQRHRVHQTAAPEVAKLIREFVK